MFNNKKRKKLDGIHLLVCRNRSATFRAYVILVPGITESCIRTYKEAIESLLREGYTVIGMELPYTEPKRQLTDKWCAIVPSFWRCVINTRKLMKRVHLMAEAKGVPFHFMGHSFGTNVITALLLWSLPSTFGCFISISTPTYVLGNVHPVLRLFHPLTRVVLYTVSMFAPCLLLPHVGASPEAREAMKLAERRDRIRAVRNLCVLDTASLVARFVIGYVLPFLNRPVYHIHGESDNTAPVQLLRQLLSQTQVSRLRTYKGVGHDPLTETGLRVLQRAMEFMKEHESLFYARQMALAMRLLEKESQVHLCKNSWRSRLTFIWGREHV